MPRTHYVVRLSKRALVPGRSLTFSRGEEVPASVVEIRTEDPAEANRLVRGHVRYDGDIADITKVNRSGREEDINHSFCNSGFASPEERQRLDISDILALVERLAAEGNQEAQELLAKHSSVCLAQGA